MYVVVPLMQWVHRLPGWPLPCFKQWGNFTLPLPGLFLMGFRALGTLNPEP